MADVVRLQDSGLIFSNNLSYTRGYGSIGRIIGEFRGQLGKTIRLGTLTRQSDAEGGFFVILVDGLIYPKKYRRFSQIIKCS